MKNVYVKLFFIITFFFQFSCSSRNYVIYNAIEGEVVSSKNQNSIEGAKIYVSKGSLNDFGIINTTKNGTFFIEGLELPYKYLHQQLNLSFNYFIEKPGYKKKVINIKNLKETTNNKLDTIDLGKIYLEPEE